MKIIRNTIFFCILLGTSGAYTVNAQVLASDSLALVALYNSTAGASWTRRTNWLVPGRPVSTWYGVIVVGNRVTQINMNPSSPPFSGNNLVGVLPPEIGNLGGLTSLDLAYNKLNGAIPTQIRNLFNLTFLNLSNNQLIGIIPNIGTLSNLTVFLANNNQLNGSIPIQIGNLNKLTQINLTFNNLSGSIPTQLGNLSNLTQLLLQNNQLTGTIPTELGLLSKLVSLSLSENLLTGSLPTQLGNLSALSEFNVTSNQLVGEIPIALGNLSNLQFLRLNRNQFSGNIPKELGSLSKLQELLLGTNQFSGVVPQELTAIGTLRNFQVQNNNLIDLPAFPSTVFTLNASNNRFTFEDLEPNRTITNFTYIPQKILPGGETQNLIIGNLFAIGFTVGGSANQYQWKKDGVNKTGAMSTIFSIPTVAFLDSGFYELFITNTLVPGLTLQTEPTRLNVAGLPVIDAKSDNATKPDGSVINFDLTDVGGERFKDLEISNTGSASLIISQIQITGDFSLQTSIPASIKIGENEIFTIRFSPTSVGLRTGTLQIFSNGSLPIFTINLAGEGDAELEIFNVVSTNKNGKHDFFHIRNIWLYPNNRVSIFDRWGNEVYSRDGYDNLGNKFTGESDKGKDLPEGTYFYVIDTDKKSKALTGFLFLRRK